MKKLFILALLVGIILFDYKLISFKHGLKIINFDNSIDVDPSLLFDINALYYYDNPFGDHYLLVVHGGKIGIKMGQVTEEQIEDFTIGGILFRQLKPIHITPIPLPVYGIIFIIIILFPSFKAKKSG